MSYTVDNMTVSSHPYQRIDLNLPSGDVCQLAVIHVMDHTMVVTTFDGPDRPSRAHFVAKSATIDEQYIEENFSIQRSEDARAFKDFLFAVIEHGTHLPW